MDSLQMWMTESEQKFFLSQLKSEDNYLEWGSGGSTIAVLPLVHSVVSIEHDETWWNKIVTEIVKFNCPVPPEYYHIPSDKPRSFPHVKREEFETYINKVHELDRTYDKVLIDGRARVWCAKEVREHLNPNARVYFHDWDRPFYHQVIDWYKIVGMRQRMVALKLK